MKKVLLALALVAGFSLSHAVEVKFKSLTWINWDNALNDNFTYQTNAGGDSKTGNLALGRNYNDFKINWNDTVKGRVNFDLSKPATPLKYAYIDWKIATPLVITIGLQKTYFGYTPIWEYEVPYKALADQVKASSSADFGFGFSGSVLNKMISYNLQILNGQGYEKPETLVNDEFALGLNVVVAPIKGLNIGASFRLAEKFHNGSTGKSYKNNALDIYADAKFGKLWALVDFLGVLPTGAAMQTSIQATVGYKVTDMFGAYVNFLNQYASDTNSTQAITLALNYLPAQAVVLKPYFTINLDGTTTTFNTGLQTEIAFGFTVGTPDVKKKEEKKMDTASTNM